MWGESIATEIRQGQDCLDWVDEKDIDTVTDSLDPEDDICIYSPGLYKSVWHLMFLHTVIRLRY